MLVKLREVTVSMKGEWSTVLQASERSKNSSTLTIEFTTNDIFDDLCESCFRGKQVKLCQVLEAKNQT